jgi:hypothetical protein
VRQDKIKNLKAVRDYVKAHADKHGRESYYLAQKALVAHAVKQTFPDPSAILACIDEFSTPAYTTEEDNSITCYNSLGLCLCLVELLTGLIDNMVAGSIE